MSNELNHFYGDTVHVLNDTLGSTLLSRLCSPDTRQPAINSLVATLYRQLVWDVVEKEMGRIVAEVPTRMIEFHPEAVWSGDIIDPNEKVVVVCIARAGIFPSQVCYDFLNGILNPERVRQDHMLMNRITADDGTVTGARIHGAKIGGSVDGATLFIPDPMGASGVTVETIVKHYVDNIEGVPDRIVCLNLIVTSEYLARVRKIQDDLKKRNLISGDISVYSYRVDRGLSSADVLATDPGKFWDRERGLNEKSYIVPGGGGFGEIMNNVFD